MSAIFSPCRKYRYLLDREWLIGKGTLNVLMLNPSTADETEDDPTIRRCINRAKGLGMQRLTVTNLFAWRATDPKQLRQTIDPIGPGNGLAILGAAREADIILLAWGNHGNLNNRAAEVLKMLSWYRDKMRCLGVTKTGQPKHPLYIPEAQELEVYSERALASSAETGRERDDA